MLTDNVKIGVDAGLDTPGEVRVPSGDLVLVVVDELLRDGVVRNDSDHPVVETTVTADDRAVTIAVSDDAGDGDEGRPGGERGSENDGSDRA
jgi:hypothetical protein